MEATFLIIGIVLLIIFLTKKNVFSYQPSIEEIGERGEDAVAETLEEICGDSNIIHDIIIVDNDTKKSTQTDHIVIRQNGIFVVETKNFAGRIYGKDEQREWTQVLRYGEIKNYFYNPVKQNNTHIIYLSKALRIKKDMFVSVVIFPKAELYVETASFVCGKRIRSLAYIFNSNQNINLTNEQMTNIYQQLVDIKNNPQITKDEHVENIYKMQSDIASNICPHCNKPLVLRNGKNGQFYGCLNYPNCCFTKPYC